MSQRRLRPPVDRCERRLGVEVVGEDARSLGPLGLTPLADSADSVVFGPGQPPPESATWYWAEVDRTRRQLSHGLSRWGRIRAAVSVRSLRTPRPPIRVSN